MVLLTVKGTKHLDEFTYECLVDDHAGTVCKAVAHIQNMRLKVKNQLYSVNELLPAAERAVVADGRCDAPLAERLGALFATVTAELKEARRPVAVGQYDAHWRALVDATAAVFPAECTHKDGEDAAITRLYELHENPDIDEDYRVHVYHCRAILDPLWRVHDMLDEAKALALWFNGRELPADAAIGSLCGGNNKSRITVKAGLSGGSAPSLEPRLSYDDQRLLRAEMDKRREVRAGLEHSELHAVVCRQTRGAVGLGVNAPSDASLIVRGGAKKEVTSEGL